jgi:tripartite-type tricarboxylate transporter receptor subunit TctC
MLAAATAILTGEASSARVLPTCLSSIGELFGLCALVSRCAKSTRRSMGPLLRSSLCAITLVLVSATVAHPQSDYPNRTIKIIAPSLPGGGVDLSRPHDRRRAVEAVGQPVVVENQSGGGGIVPSLATARAAPDGYTLMVGFVSTHGTNPAVRKLPYDAIKEFTPIAMVAGTPNVFVVGPTCPRAAWRSLSHTRRPIPTSSRTDRRVRAR